MLTNDTPVVLALALAVAAPPQIHGRSPDPPPVGALVRLRKGVSSRATPLHPPTPPTPPACCGSWVVPYNTDAKKYGIAVFEFAPSPRGLFRTDRMGVR